jgi:hypothetical protein
MVVEENMRRRLPSSLLKDKKVGALVDETVRR